MFLNNGQDVDYHITWWQKWDKGDNQEMAQLRLEPPEPFNLRTPDDWPRWKQWYEQFRVASGLESEVAVKQVNTLLYCMGEEADSVLASTNVTEEERKVYATVVGKFDSFFKVRRNIIFERARFNKRNQREGETSERYIMDLYRLAENCGYGALKEEMIRDRLVVGIRDAVLSQQLQLDSELTLEKTKKKIRQREAVGEQQRELKGPAEGAVKLEAMYVRRQFKGRRPNIHGRDGKAKATPRAAPGAVATKTCSRCGGSSHAHDKCHAKEATCHRCNKKGHYRSQCFTKQVSELTSESILETAFLNTLATEPTSAWFASVKLNEQEINFKLDTGAEVTAISEEVYQGLQKPKLSTPEKALYGPSRQPLKTLGQFHGCLSHKNKVVKQRIFVVEGLQKNLGLPAITSLGLAIRVDATEASAPTAVAEAPIDFKAQYPAVFQGLGNLGEEYKICLKPGATPHSLFTPRHVPLPLRPKVHDELNRMEALGVISKVDEPTLWCAGMVVVPKKEGAIRICVDMKKLNESVLREVHPLPDVNETLAQLSGAKVFSKLDANSGFWQIPLAKESRLLTTFITPFGRYCFNKMPFGISSAPEHFQKRMSNFLTGLSGVLGLIDDVLVFGSDQKEHDERLTAALERIKEAGATLNPSKCEFRKTQLKFLGHLIDPTGIRADPEKTSAIAGMKAPTNVPELRRFMGMANQLGKFSHNLADLTQPVRLLLSKKSSWLWGPDQERAFAESRQSWRNRQSWHSITP